ncbi:TIM barrel protein [Rhodopirellula sp. JC740]|uniref:TIM barrel protein n=1 Tax=Rhodopirellula halodulae TaxID=2894198 RepID=A0ABS8NKE4_9BACT|nr:TIM barrel protein [Rhodopirellula sp. JC740]MCC9643432.1 TIM barrel protein [Rhodopirellula sp. JC740]
MPLISPQDVASPNANETQTKNSDSKLKQSIMGWCFKPMPVETLAKEAKQIGYVALEGIGAEHYPMIQKMGLEISLVGSHGFQKGPVDPANHDSVEKSLRDGIDLAVKVGSPSVITFTGMHTPGISDQAAFENCVACWKRVMPYAEQNGIQLVLEHLNSVDDSHPMKGHPGYWGDDIHRCVDLIRAVDSPSMKLLFDVYHVQIMHGDVIRHLRRYHETVGHYHTAGNPGRGELDFNQEINYPPIIRAIRETGYTGYVAQEFIPTRPDPIDSLRQAFTLCDV